MDSFHRKEDEDHQQLKSSRWTQEVRDWIKSIGTAVIIVLLLNQFVFNLSTVEGSSMEPTLESKEWLFINRVVYWFGDPERGDIVIIKDPEASGEQKYLVKRVVAVPGDTVEIKAGLLYLNGEVFNESYIDVKIEDGDFAPFTVQNGHYFVMGDNRHRHESWDSRSFGAVSSDLIQGRADFILWPLTKAGGL